MHSNIALALGPHNRDDDRNHYNNNNPLQPRFALYSTMPLRPYHTEGAAFDTRDEAVEELQKWAFNEGYAVATRRPSDKDKMTGEYRRYDVYCTRGGRPFEQQGHGLRETATKKTDCLFRGKIVCRKSHGDQWVYNSMNTLHNHEPFDSPAAEPLHRKRHGEDLEEIRVASKVGNITNRTMVSLVKAKRPDALLTSKDVSNDLRKLREEAGPLSQTQSFVSKLERDNIYSRVVYQDNRLKAAFWSLPAGIEALSQYHGILTMDATYKINRFNMPFFEINGITPYGSHFPAAFALISEEDGVQYTWVIQQLKGLFSYLSIDIENKLYVIVTDDDQRLKPALTAEFPTVQQQLCLWHIQKNVGKNLKEKWIGPLGGLQEITSAEAIQNVTGPTGACSALLWS